MVQSAYMIKREQKALMAEDSLLHDFKDKINHLLALQSSLHKIKTFFSENKLSKAKKEVQALEEYIKKEENGLEQIANKIGRVERKRYSFQKRVERIIPNLEKKLFLKKKINLNEKKKVESVMDDIHTLSARAIKELSYDSPSVLYCEKLGICGIEYSKTLLICTFRFFIKFSNFFLSFTCIV